jgi:hypothetical protein
MPRVKTLGFFCGLVLRRLRRLRIESRRAIRPQKARPFSFGPELSS